MTLSICVNTWAETPAYKILMEESLVIDEVEYLVDRDGRSVGETLLLPSLYWSSLRGGVSLGQSEYANWFRFEVTSAHRENQERLLEVAYPLLDWLDVFIVHDGEILRAYRLGDARPFDLRPISHRNFVIPFALEPDVTYSFYLRVKTDGYIQLPLKLWQERAFFLVSEQLLLPWALFYSLLVVMACFNLILFLFVFERAYFSYALSVFALIVLMANQQGFASQYLFPMRPEWHELTMMLSIPIYQIFLIQYSIDFLGLKRKNSRWYWLLATLAGFNCVSIVMAFSVPYNVTIAYSMLMTLPNSLLACGVGYIIWRQGERSARLYTFGWGFLCVGIGVTVLDKFGLIPTSLMAVNGVAVGSTCQIVFFALALADRVNQDRKVRLSAQEASISEMKRRSEIEERLHSQASHHEHSGLPNRQLFERAVQSCIHRVPEGNDTVGVVLLHLRQFDDVNKTLGHKNADELIKRVAMRLVEAVSTCEGAIPIELRDEKFVYVAHVEGVSFAFAVAGLNEAFVVQKIERVTNLMMQPIEFMGLSLDLRFVVGCSFGDAKDIEPHTLLREAFIAFDQANNFSTVALYEPSMNPYSSRRLTLMAELRTALENDLLELYFQPQVHLAERRIAGFECLLRWNHRSYGFVSPDEFIPVAERTGLIKPLTRWVIKQALRFAQELKKQGYDLSIAVNVSAVNLSEVGFCEEVGQLLLSLPGYSKNLVLEVTETAAMLDPKSAIESLKILRDEGVTIAIDDFGTGHSSLSYIRKLPVEEIKIDRSFVMDMAVNSGDATIVRTMINMSHDLGYRVVAEGVESSDILEMLAEMKCELAQGYFIAKPMPVSDVLIWLETSHWCHEPDNRLTDAS